MTTQSRDGTSVETLEIELEDVGGTSWWAGVLTTLGAQGGNAYLRFVGTVDGERRYRSATFVSPRSLGYIPPQEQWAPGMSRCLGELRREIAEDGWFLVSSGDQPWDLRYERPVRS